MKKLVSILISAAILFAVATALTSCEWAEKIADGGKDIVDNIADNGKNAVTSWKYDYAIISVPDGTTIKVDIDSWSTNGSETVTSYYIFGADGYGYIVSARNCMLVNDPEIDIDKLSFTGLNKLNYTYDTVWISNPDGTVTVIDEFEDVNAATNVVLLEDENGVVYTVHPDNRLIKFKYN